MKILFLGDVVAKSGRNLLIERLPSLKELYEVDLVIVNGENAAHGKGITKKIYDQFINVGVDVVTLGNHAFSKSEIKEVIDECPNLVRPYNLEPKELGNACVIKEVCGRNVAIVNVLGEVFMDCATQSPFEVMDELLPQIDANIIIVDFHTETTGEKQLFLHQYKDVLSAVIGTHTHVQTADEKIVGGCAYISDVGMCGVYDSILGRSIDEVIKRHIEKEKTHFAPADGPSILCGCLIEIDDETGRALSIERIQERPN